MKLILTADRLVDGTGSTPLTEGALVVENGRIVQVTTRDRLPPADDPGDEIIDLPGGTIMPGFVEAHSHMHCSAEAEAYRQIVTEPDHVLLMRAVQAVRQALASGVTSMRDLGSKNEVAFPIKRAIEDGIIPGPTLLVAGTPITTTGGHCHMFGTEADSVEDVLSAIRGQVKIGADWIKIMSTGGNFTPRTNIRAAQYPVETLRAAVADAERLGIRVAAHCHGAVGVRNCVEAGIHNLIHCTWVSSDRSESYDYDPAVADQIAEKGLYVDPTIAGHSIREARGVPVDTALRDGFRSDPPRRYEILRDMWDRGVKFVAGLDTGMPHIRFGDYAYTPQAMVEKIGVSPMDAIVCCTKTSAECLGILDETGTLEAGKLADAVIVAGDPTSDIRAMHRVDTVVKRGTVFVRDGKLLV